MPRETNDGVLELTREEFQEAVKSAAKNAIKAREAELKQREEARDLQLSRTAAELHTMRVEKKIQGLEAQGHAPAVIKVAQEIYEADAAGDTVLTLSREDEEIELSPTQIVDAILAALPATALTEKNLRLARDFKAPVGDNTDYAKTVDERAQSLWDELKAVES